ncbi:MAG: CehA/McbA family metallohydrolase [Sandaracinaceae bacterium]|nr:CehA/McbA family metallohydrolase [Sandaracinaceae bacterium]
MCADYHIHTHRSPDSPDSPVLKLMGLIADGLEIAIRSDHEWVNDFQPLIESMGLTEHAFGISGEELTTFAWGHFGVFPLSEDRSQVNSGAVPWIGSLPPAVFDAARARPEQPAFIINHPRSGGVLGGYFAAAGLDNATGMVSRPEYWDEDFTLVEVFNDGDFERFRADVVADWFSLLNSGRRVFAVGSSDSHGIYGSPVGYPRTCLALGTDDPRDLTPNMVRDVTGAGHSTISGGLYLSVVGPGGAGPGDDVTGAGETATFEITVQAACWIRATQLEVIVDGVTTETIPIPTPSACEVVRLDAASISVPVAAAGSWVVFHASGDMDLSPVHPGRMPFAVSNPVFLSR